MGNCSSGRSCTSNVDVVPYRPLQTESEFHIFADIVDIDSSAIGGASHSPSLSPSTPYSSSYVSSSSSSQLTSSGSHAVKNSTDIFDPVGYPQDFQSISTVAFGYNELTTSSVEEESMQVEVCSDLSIASTATSVVDEPMPVIICSDFSIESGWSNEPMGRRGDFDMQPNSEESLPLEIDTLVDSVYYASKAAASELIAKSLWKCIIGSPRVLSYCRGQDVFKLICCCKYFSADSLNARNLFVSVWFDTLRVTSTLCSSLSQMAYSVDDSSGRIHCTSAATLYFRLSRVTKLVTGTARMDSKLLSMLVRAVPRLKCLNIGIIPPNSLIVALSGWCWLPSTLLNLSIGMVGLTLEMDDSQLAQILMQVGCNLRSLTLRKVSSLSSRSLRIVGRCCPHIEEFSVISCRDLARTVQCPSGIDDLSACLEALGPRLKVLDVRYSVQLDDNILRICECYLNDKLLVHFLASRTAPYSCAPIVSTSSQCSTFMDCVQNCSLDTPSPTVRPINLTLSQWYSFMNKFISARVLFVDNAASIHSILEMEHILYKAPPPHVRSRSWCRFKSLEDYYQWFELPVFDPDIRTQRLTNSETL